MGSLTTSEKQRTLLIGFLAGVLAGLFGVGGGFLMVPLYLAWLKIDQKKAHATSLGAIVPIAISGAIGYASSGDVNWKSAAFRPAAIALLLRQQKRCLPVHRLSHY